MIWVKFIIAIIVFIALEMIGDSLYNAVIATIDSTLDPSFAITLLKTSAWIFFYGSPAIPPIFILK